MKIVIMDNNKLTTIIIITKPIIIIIINDGDRPNPRCDTEKVVYSALRKLATYISC